MMNEMFDELLKRYNDGVSKGAPARFAKESGLTDSTISRYRKLASYPDERLRSKLAKVLGTTVEELMACFPNAKKEPALAPADVKVPIIAIISSKNFNIDLHNYKQLEEITVRTKEGDGKLLGLKVSGDWLSPVAKAFTYCAIPSPGDIFSGRASGTN